MSGKVYDRKRLTVDRDPSRQLAVEFGKFPAASPADLVKSFAAALESYGLEAIEEVTGLDLSGLKTALDRLKALLGGVDLFGGDGDPFDPAAAVAQFFASVPAAVLATLGGAKWGDLLGALTGGAGAGDGLDDLADFFKNELGAPITAGRLPLLPLSHIRNVQPNLLNDPSFDDEATLLGLDDWDWDDTDGRTRPGCAYTMADGATHILHSEAIPVAVDDKLDEEIYAKWTGLTIAGGATPIRLNCSAYTAADVLIGGAAANLAAVGTAGDSAGWVKLSTAGWVPPAGADYVVMEPTVLSTATGGAVRFDDGRLAKVGALPQSYVNGLVDALTAAADRVQAVINQIWTGITRQTLDGPKVLADLWNAFGAIPAGNMQGIAGGNTIVDTFQETWTQLWGGFARSIGTGKTIADAANAAQDVASDASQAVQIGEWNNAVLGIRNNRPFDSGVDPTAVSMFPIPAATASNGEPIYLNATAASAPAAFWIAPDDSTRGSVQWLGKGNANITALYLDVYRVNADGSWTFLHTSPDQFPQLTAGVKLCRYDMASAVRPLTAHGNVLAIVWRVQGTGTHQIGARYGLATGDATQVPQRPSAVRTAAGPGLVGNVSAAQAPALYGGDVPWVALGIVAGDVAPPYYAPRTTQFATVGTYTYDIPTWANYVDVVYLSGGGSGHGGDGGFNRSGEGGWGGLWAAETLVRGVDFPANATQITFTVPAGGAAVGKETNGFVGGAASRAAIPGGKAAFSVAGGDRGDQYDNDSGAGSNAGKSPGPFTFNGVPYTGGAQVSGGNSANGQTGSAPGGGGGGGGGGIYGVAFGGGAGARGQIWATARST